VGDRLEPQSVALTRGSARGFPSLLRLISKSDLMAVALLMSRMRMAANSQQRSPGSGIEEFLTALSSMTRHRANEM
jgi:hypothetical protein